MTAPAASPPHDPARRRALDDLGLPIDAATLGATGEPALARRDRAAAFEAYAALPAESNLLYSPTSTCAPRSSATRELVTEPGHAPSVASLPDDAAAIIAIDEGDGRRSPCRRGRGRRLVSHVRRGRDRADRAALLEAAVPAGERQVRPADPRARGPAWSSSTCQPACARASRSSCAGRSVRPIGRSSPGPSCASATGRQASVVEELVASATGRGRRPARLLRGARPRSPSGPAPRSRSPASRSCRPTSSRSSTALADDRRGRDAPVGARPARRPARARRARQPPRRRSQLGRAGRDRVRQRRPAVRPDLVHDATSARTRPATCSRRARSSTGAGLPQGPDHHREDRDRDRQLPRRVRDEPVEAGALGRHPERSRSTSRTAGARRTARRSGRSTRRSSSTSSRAASRRTRRASSSSSGSSSRSWRASRWPPRRSGCATCSRPSGRPGRRRQRRPQPERHHDRRPRPR